MPPKAKQAKGPKVKSAYKLAEIDAEGLVFTDILKRQWKIGKPIGNGGFGLIYQCSAVSESSNQDAGYIMKIEPHDNGPLYCELNYYRRVAKAELIDEWKKGHKLLHLGVPKFIACGSYEDSRQTKYRFLVMERFGTDLQQLLDKNGQRFPLKTVLLVGLQMLDVLEYIHSKGFVHADVKASNILLADGQPNPRHVYLVDYGLASQFNVDFSHREYKEDPTKAHDGTVDFTSRDAHLGVKPSRRGDLEILGYCLLQWCAGTLPWAKNINDKDKVRDMKIRYMKDIRSLIADCKITDSSDLFFDYLNYVARLDYKGVPAYDLLRDILRRGLQRSSTDSTLVFSGAQVMPGASQTGRKRAATSPSVAGKRAKSKTPPSALPASSSVEQLSCSTSSSGLPPSKRPKKANVAPKSAAAGEPPIGVNGSASGLSVSAGPHPIKARSPLANGRLAPTPSASVPAAAASCGSTPANGHVPPARRPLKIVSTASTQTSPSLKGLKQRRK